MAPNGSSDKEDDGKAPNLIERAKEDIVGVILGCSDGTTQTHYHYKETRGQRTSDMNEALDDVKGPNVYDRVKEEEEALVHTIHTKNHNRNVEAAAESEPDALADVEIRLSSSTFQNFSLQEWLFLMRFNATSEKASKQVKSTDSSPHHHQKETYGRSNDIDEDTPIDVVKGSNVFERAKEEIEALVETIHSKKEPASKSEGGFRVFIGKALAKICHPWDAKKV